jgi:serine/threonine-protein kinase RsbW
MDCSASGYQLKQMLQRCYFVEDWCYRPIQTRADMGDFLEEICKTLDTLGFSHRDVMGVRVALEEAIVNSIKHGHREDPAKRVHVKYHITQHLVLVEVQDEGSGFQPDLAADPTAAASIGKESGSGLFLMRHYMTWVRFSENGTCVTLCKHRAFSGASLPSG